MQEMWKYVKGYEGAYSVSNTGRVYSHKSEKILKTSATGYGCVMLRKDGAGKIKYVHRLVAEAFVPNPENKPEVNHIDHNTQNNFASNLEWVTHLENCIAYERHKKEKKYETYNR